MTWQAELAERARSILPPPVWEYVTAGAREGASEGEAVDAWQQVRFAPHVLTSPGEPDVRAVLLGAEVATPVGVAPTSMQRAIHPEGERAMAVGAAAAGALHVVSSNAGHLFSDIAASGPWWLQAYLPPRREDALPVLAAAAGAGARAVVLTVDTPFPGTKYVAPDDAWSDIDLSWFRCNFAEPGVVRWADDLTVTDIGWLRDRVGLPVVVKGVLRPDDAERCLAAGADAVWVSNHGGRQLDRTLATRYALPPVVAAVAGRAPVYVDGGIRSGLDALGALALGADAVFLGRLPLHGLAVSGGQGAQEVLERLTDELVEGLRLAGCRTPGDAPDILGPDPPNGL